jgi:hypothetical protein
MSAELEDQIGALVGLGRKCLDQRSRGPFKAAPPASFTRDLLARGIAYHLQERALGGLAPKARQQLRQEDGSRTQRRSSVRSGNRLVRRWRGRTYVVEAVDEGFVYAGQTFLSLSEIARLIMGSRWSGPRFFGLVR